jgi:hypothetical protein
MKRMTDPQQSSIPDYRGLIHAPDAAEADEWGWELDGRLRVPVSISTGGLAPGFSTLEDAVAAAGLAEDRRRAR